MKIAFVGKGGSGKSTVTALFVHYLTHTDQHILAVDADINQHLASLIGAEFDESYALSAEHRTYAITQALSQDNTRIDPEHMVKTTPPGTGSHIIRLRSDDLIIREHSKQFARDGYFMHVGTYDEEGIGTSCYHGNLAVFENIVSHTDVGDNEWLVADMVAGTDAFAGALYLMFDAIVIVVEPTPESASVYEQFMKLAASSGVADRVIVVANKVMDVDDMAYLRTRGIEPIVHFAYDASLKRARQQHRPIETGRYAPECRALSQDITRMTPDKNARLRELHELHRKYAGQAYVHNAHGDLIGQIDAGFRL